MTISCIKEDKFLYKPESSTLLTSPTWLKSVKKGIKSVNSVSWLNSIQMSSVQRTRDEWGRETYGSLYQDDIGTELVGWNTQHAGELSIMIHSDLGLPNCDKSYTAILRSVPVR